MLPLALLLISADATDRWKALEAAAQHGLKLEDGDLAGVLGAVIRPRFVLDQTGKFTPDFAMIRPTLRVIGAGGRALIFIQPELASDPRILDAELRVAIAPWLGLRVGRFVTGFSRSFYTPVPKLKFPEFAASNTFFRTDRDVGATVYGSIAPLKLDYEAGVVTGVGVQSKLQQASPLPIGLARVSWHAIGTAGLDENRCKNGDCPLFLGFGANVWWQEGSETNGLDVAFGWRRLQVQAEIFHRFAKAPATGGYVHASFAAVPKWLEVSGRIDLLDKNLLASGDFSVTTDAMLVSYPLGEHFKVWLVYTAQWLPSVTQKATLELQIYL